MEIERPEAITWNRKGGDKVDQANLMVCLAVMVEAVGKITLDRELLEQADGSLGLRARYEDDGSITLWAYDVVEDIKDIARGAT